MLCADVVLFKLVRKLHNFDLIVLDLSGVSFPGYRLEVFSLWCSCFRIISLINCYLILLINRDIWRGIFAALAVVSAGYLNFCLDFFLSICWYLVSMLHTVG
jgi:hypothetical protein